MDDLPDIQFPLPQAYGDPAFIACLHESIGAPELVKNFDRLYGCNLSGQGTALDRMIDKSTGRIDGDMNKFVEFVHDCIYLRLPADSIRGLRMAAMGAV